MEEASQQPDLQKEVENAISIVNSKNVNAGTINAGGNVTIGDKTTNITQNADKIYNINHIDKADFS